MFLTAWLGAALSLLDGTARAPQHPVPDRNPVLLIHGIADNSDCMRRMAIFLRADGFEVHTIDLTPNLGQAGLEPLAAAIQHYADTTLRGRTFDLVGFSMGGLVSRYYVQRLGGLQRVERFITISAPHHGTHFARLIPNDGCRAMRPGSPFIRDLATDADDLWKVKFTSLYTPWDAIILPSHSSAMPQARNIPLRNVGTHPGMVLRKTSLRALATALQS